MTDMPSWAQTMTKQEFATAWMASVEECNRLEKLLDKANALLLDAWRALEPREPNHPVVIALERWANGP